jgi:hypothetical protein
MSFNIKKIHLIFSRVNIAILLVAVPLLAAFSLRWPIMNDLALNLYNGYLMSAFHAIPYRDFFDVNAPGTHFFYYFIHVLSNGSGLICRIIDLVLLAGLGLSTYILLRPYGKKAAVASPLIFSVMYLAMGPSQSLQREYVTLLPLALALVAAFRIPAMPVFSRSLVIGLLFGMAASIKPLLVIVLPFLLVFVSLRWHDPRESEGSLYSALGRSVAGAGAGFACVCLAFGIYFGVHGTLGPFLEIVRQYWPLYNKLDESGFTYERVPIWAWARWVKTFPFISAIPFFSLSVLGAVLLPIQKMSRERKLETGALFALVLCSFAYIPLSNKFWLYHWIPLYYSLSIFTGFSIQAGGAAAQGLRVPVLAVVLTVISIPFGFLADEAAMAKQHRTHVVNQGDVDEIQRFLQTRLGSQDTVLPLDMVSGAINGMYRARARLAGKFNSDYYFYHHTDRPIIQKLRRELLRTFTDHPPRFIIRFHESWRPIGPYSDRSFPEFERIIETQYETVLASERFVIMRQKSPQPEPRP